MNIKSGADILRICAEDKCSLSNAALRYEMKRNDVTEEYVFNKMRRVFIQMKTSILRGNRNIRILLSS